MVSCEVVIGKRTLLIGTYLPPSTLDHLPDLAEDLPRFRDHDTNMSGGLNYDIQAQNPRSQQVADLLIEFWLVDLHHHLISTGSSDTCNVVSD